MRYSLLLLGFLLFLLYLVLFVYPTSVFAFCEFGYCTNPNDIPNGGCPCNPNFRDPITGLCTQEVCSIQPPVAGACCAPPFITPTPTPPPTIACRSDSDCIDGNPCTSDYCANAGTSSSFCSITNHPYGTVCGRDSLGQQVTCCNGAGSCSVDCRAYSQTNYYSQSNLSNILGNNFSSKVLVSSVFSNSC